VGCLLVTSKAYGSLSPADQRALAAAAAKGGERFDEVSRQQEQTLLHGGFQHQGVQVVPVSESFRSQFFEAARQARDRLAPSLLPADLLAKVRPMLADYRAEHPQNK
jgi:TRAP-type C4-dicarboxylate transport system substrate-binding protein